MRLACLLVCILGTVAPEEFRPVPLPTEFNSYDIDGNGFIDVEELAEVSDTRVDQARNPFSDADTDENGQVSPDEFNAAPWSLFGEVQNAEMESQNSSSAEEDISSDVDREGDTPSNIETEEDWPSDVDTQENEEGDENEEVSSREISFDEEEEMVDALNIL